MLQYDDEDSDTSAYDTTFEEVDSQYNPNQFSSQSPHIGGGVRDDDDFDYDDVPVAYQENNNNSDQQVDYSSKEDHHASQFSPNNFTEEFYTETHTTELDIDVLPGEQSSKGDHVIYPITSKPKQGSTGGQYQVKRRFNDFCWFNEQLEIKYPEYLIPPMPEKALFTSRFDKELIGYRTRELVKFLNQVARHRILARSKELEVFLTASEEEFSALKNKGNNNGALAMGLDTFKSIFGGLSAKATMVAFQPKEEDQWVIEKNDALGRLQAALKSAEKVTSIMVARHKDLVNVYTDLNGSFTNLGESVATFDPSVTDTFKKINIVFAEQSKLFLERSICEKEAINQRISYYIRALDSVRRMMAHRLEKLGAMQEASSVALNKGIARDSKPTDPAAGAEFQQAQTALEAATNEFNRVNAICKEEIELFEKSMVRGMLECLANFQRSNEAHDERSRDGWKRFCEHISAQTSTAEEE